MLVLSMTANQPDGLDDDPKGPATRTSAGAERPAVSASRRPGSPVRQAAPSSRGVSPEKVVDAITSELCQQIAVLPAGDKYVEITNSGNADGDISGRRFGAREFVFSAGTVLRPNQSVRVYTNEVHLESGGCSYAIAQAIWSNGDKPTLTDAAGNLVSAP